MRETARKKLLSNWNCYSTNGGLAQNRNLPYINKSTFVSLVGRGKNIRLFN